MAMLNNQRVPAKSPKSTDWYSKIAFLGWFWDTFGHTQNIGGAKLLRNQNHGFQIFVSADLPICHM